MAPSLDELFGKKNMKKIKKERGSITHDAIMSSAVGAIGPPGHHISLAEGSSLFCGFSPPELEMLRTYLGDLNMKTEDLMSILQEVRNSE